MGEICPKVERSSFALCTDFSSLLNQRRGSELLLSSSSQLSRVVSRERQLFACRYNLPIAHFKFQARLFWLDPTRSGLFADVQRSYLRRWCKEGGDLSIRTIVDWAYYKMRLGSAVQKIITIPAAMQKVRAQSVELNSLNLQHKLMNLVLAGVRRFDKGFENAFMSDRCACIQVLFLI